MQRIGWVVLPPCGVTVVGHMFDANCMKPLLAGRLERAHWLRPPTGLAFVTGDRAELHLLAKEHPVMRANQRVADWMTSDPLTIAPELSATEAYERMRAHSVRRLPVLDASGLLVGMITRSDIEAAVALPRDEEGWRSARFALAGTTVADLMTAHPVTVAADEPIAAAAALMIQSRVSGLPVLHDSRLVGIITESDIFRLVVASWADA